MIIETLIGIGMVCRTAYCWRQAINAHKFRFISAETKQTDFNSYWSDKLNAEYWDRKTKVWASATIGYTVVTVLFLVFL